MNFSELFADEDYRFQMSLRRGSTAEFFHPTANHAEIVAERRHWLRSTSDTYSAWRAEAGPLLEECLCLAAEWRTISPEQQAQLATLTGPRERCAALGEIWAPDFILLKAEAEGRFHLVGGCVCFPSSWSLAEKIGQPLASIHGPVPGLNAQFSRAIDTFLGRLAPGAAWLRHNWGLSRSAELNQHPARALPRLDATVTMPEVWLRVEHQLLVALPRSGGVLFGIRVTSHPLAMVIQETTVASRLARALRTMPEPVAAYKGLAPARARILQLLEA